MVKALYTKVIKFGKDRVQVPGDNRLTDRKLMATATKDDFKKLLKEFRKKPVLTVLPMPIPKNPDIEIKQKDSTDNSSVIAA